MAQLVGQGELAVEIVLVVEENIGVDGAAAGVGPAALALVLIDIHPAGLKAGGGDAPVVLPQDPHRLQHLLPGLGEGDGPLGGGDDGDEEIVHVQRLQPQGLLAQGHIAVHLVHVPVDRVDEAVVHRLRHLRQGHGAGQGALIPPGAGVEQILGHGAAQHGGQGVAAAAVGGVEGVEGVFPQGPVAALQKGDIGAVGQRMLPALAVGHRGEFQVRVNEAVEDLPRESAHLPGAGQQLLLRRGEDVGPLGAGPGEIPAVLLQGGEICIEGVQGLLRDGRQLRVLKGQGAAELDQEGDRPAHHVLVDRVGGVLVPAQGGVGPHPVHLPVRPLPQLQVVKEGLGRRSQPPPVGPQLLRQALAGREGLLPGLIAGKQILDAPAVRRILLASLFDGQYMLHGLHPFWRGHSPAPAASILARFSPGGKGRGAVAGRRRESGRIVCDFLKILLPGLTLGECWAIV